MGVTALSFAEVLPETRSVGHKNIMSAPKDLRALPQELLRLVREDTSAFVIQEPRMPYLESPNVIAVTGLLANTYLALRHRGHIDNI